MNKLIVEKYYFWNPLPVDNVSMLIIDNDAWLKYNLKKTCYKIISYIYK